MKTVIITCDHCGREVEEKEAHRGFIKGDLCPECRDEEMGLGLTGHRLDDYLMDRWETGGLALVEQGVATIIRTAGNFDERPSKYSVARLVVWPLPKDPAVNFYIGSYHFISFHGQKDKYGKNGYNIYHTFHPQGIASRIRWRKVQSGAYRWDNAFAFDKDKPGELLWNRSMENDITELGEIVQLTLQDLEVHYALWSGNI
jgi:hypothetical protein